MLPNHEANMLKRVGHRWPQRCEQLPAPLGRMTAYRDNTCVHPPLRTGAEAE